MIYAVSACLLGDNCKYSGGNNLDENVVAYCKDKQCIKICPETLGGLKIPRCPAEITGGSGEDVLLENAKVIDKNGEDVTAGFVRGAYKALDALKEVAHEGEEFTAILKANSPSCGCGRIYDGNFEGTLIEGNGVTAALFKQKGINVLTEKDIIRKEDL